MFFQHLDTDLFKITIIGKGWKKIVDGLRQKNVEVKYYNFFLELFIFMNLIKSIILSILETMKVL